MAGYRKLGRTSSQRKALLRNQVTDLLYYGKIVRQKRKRFVKSQRESLLWVLRNAIITTL